MNLNEPIQLCHFLYLDGVVYNKNADDYPAGEILYDSDTSQTDIIGMADNEGVREVHGVPEKIWVQGIGQRLTG